MQVLKLHHEILKLHYTTQQELAASAIAGGMTVAAVTQQYAQKLCNVVADTGLRAEQVEAWLRSQRWPREYSRRIRLVPPGGPAPRFHYTTLPRFPQEQAED